MSRRERRDYRHKGLVALLYETVSGVVCVNPENLSSHLAGVHTDLRFNDQHQYTSLTVI